MIVRVRVQLGLVSLSLFIRFWASSLGGKAEGMYLVIRSQIKVFAFKAFGGLKILLIKDVNLPNFCLKKRKRKIVSSAQGLGGSYMHAAFSLLFCKDAIHIT